MHTYKHEYKHDFYTAPEDHKQDLKDSCSIHKT